MKKVAIIMGSKSDAPIVKKAFSMLQKFGVPTEVRVMSAHRTPEEAVAFVEKAKHNNIGLFICAAGKAAHLAGVVAGHTTLPVIGLPIKSSTMDGLDSLLSTVQMPSGVPVATVAVNGGENAGILAVQMLAIEEPILQKKLEVFKVEMAEQVKKDDKAIIKEFEI